LFGAAPARRVGRAPAAASVKTPFSSTAPGLAQSPHRAAHLAWMRRMPVVQQVLAEKGYRR